MDAESIATVVTAEAAASGRPEPVVFAEALLGKAQERPIKKVVLSRSEEIVAVVPEVASGPGWRNSIVWVYVMNWATGGVRTESLQPEEQTDDMLILHRVAAEMHRALLAAVPKEKK